MGLDMFLAKRIYVGANYEHREVKGTISLTAGGKEISVDLSKVSYIVESAGYWRKANAVHRFFVEKTQGGVDDCRETYVPVEVLKDLKERCVAVLEDHDKAMELLPPQEGFFFGKIELDEYYFESLEETIEIIDSLDLETGEYSYCSSW